MDINNISDMFGFKYNDENITVLVEKDENGIPVKKHFYNQNLEEISEQNGFLRAADESLYEINEKERKLFIKALEKKNKTEEKIQKKKNIYWSDRYKNMPSDQFMKDYQFYNDSENFYKEQGIYEGQVFEITSKYKNPDTNEYEVSKAYMEVFRDKNNNLRIREPLDYKNKNQTNLFQAANVAALNGLPAIALVSEQYKKNAMHMYYLDNGGDESKFNGEYDSYISFLSKDVTKTVTKERAKRKSEKKEEIKKLRNKNDNNDYYKLELFKKVPSNITNKYKEKGYHIDEEKYTQKIFNMFKHYAAVPEEDRQMNINEKKVFNSLLKEMSKYIDNENEQKKIFSQWVFDNNYSENDNTRTPAKLEVLANMYEKTLSDKFKGYKIKRTEHTNLEREKNLEAVKNGTLPIMKNTDEVNYIYNPDTHQIYRGEQQMQLQRNNLTNNYSTDTYSPLPDCLQQNMTFNRYIPKFEFVDIGTDAFGRRHYQCLVPVKPTYTEKKQAKLLAKMEKVTRKEEYRRAVADAKFQKKYGILPEYITSLQPLPVNQPPLISANELKNPLPKPTNESTIADKIAYDTTAYIISMMTKTPYKMETDWNDKETKKALADFIRTKPEEYKKIQDKAYSDVQQIIKNNTNINSNINENTAENENKLSKKKTR